MKPLTPQLPRRRLPRPGLSFFMLGLWLLLVGTNSVGHLLLGSFLAWAIPFFCQAFWPQTQRLQKPRLALRFGFRVLGDIVIANIALAKRVLGPTAQLQPAFIQVPLDLTEDFTITLLASAISLTPGTVSADLSLDRKFLLVHALHVDDIDTTISELKTRYEAPLKEIFEC